VDGEERGLLMRQIPTQTLAALSNAEFLEVMRRQAAGECGFVKAYRKRIFRLMRELIELTSAE
jgi:hypothetical protein